MKVLIFVIVTVAASFSHACPDLQGLYVSQKDEAETLRISQSNISSYEFQQKGGQPESCVADGSQKEKVLYKGKGKSKLSVTVKCYCHGSTLIQLTSVLSTDDAGNRVYPDTKEVVEVYAFNVWAKQLHRFYSIDAGLGITTAQGETIYKKK